MLDAAARRLIDGPLNWAGRRLARAGLTADQVTLAAFAIGLLACGAIALRWFGVGLALILLNRVLDGLDGAVARATAPTDRGGYLDITLDFAFYGLVPVAFALADPPANGFAAAVLIAAFYVNGSAFLAHAALQAKRGAAPSERQGRKSLDYMAGLAEGSETIAAFVVFCLWPAWFPVTALVFAGLCWLSAVARIVVGWRRLG